MRVRTETVRFRESARELENPDRGFYSICSFLIADDETDYRTDVFAEYAIDTVPGLTMLQINLRHYRTGEISGEGLANIEALFDAFAMTNKRLIVRFVYDTEGRNLQQEPEKIEIVLTHMKQLEPVLQKYSDRIFTMQGLFVGNWGELHGTRYGSKESLRRLALQLAQVTDETTYLAVRTPVQWRTIMESVTKNPINGQTAVCGPEPECDTDNIEYGKNVLENRLGLFNDGMLGSETDYGTYGPSDSGMTGTYDKWSREKELDFQEELCRHVPNGGEVIIPNSCNDIENAIEDMRRMHVTYLNREYDEGVLEKWKNSVVTEPGCFDGMDGCSYIERHLGYRFVLDQVDYVYRFWENKLLINITVKNAGFAPMYWQPEMELVFCGEQGNPLIRQKLDGNLRELTGGKEADKKRKIRAYVAMEDIPAGKYAVYFRIWDPVSERQIELANEQEAEVYGYRIGEVSYR